MARTLKPDKKRQAQLQQVHRGQGAGKGPAVEARMRAHAAPRPEDGEYRSGGGAQRTWAAAGVERSGRGERTHNIYATCPACPCADQGTDEGDAPAEQTQPAGEHGPAHVSGGSDGEGSDEREEVSEGSGGEGEDEDEEGDAAAGADSGADEEAVEDDPLTVAEEAYAMEQAALSAKLMQWLEMNPGTTHDRAVGRAEGMGIDHPEEAVHDALAAVEAQRKREKAQSQRVKAQRQREEAQRQRDEETVTEGEVEERPVAGAAGEGKAPRGAQGKKAGAGGPPAGRGKKAAGGRAAGVGTATHAAGAGTAALAAGAGVSGGPQAAGAGTATHAAGAGSAPLAAGAGVSGGPPAAGAGSAPLAAAAPSSKKKRRAPRTPGADDEGSVKKKWDWDIDRFSEAMQSRDAPNYVVLWWDEVGNRPDGKALQERLIKLAEEVRGHSVLFSGNTT